MSHHYHEEDDAYDAYQRECQAADRERQAKRKTILEELGTDAAAKFDAACQLVKSFTHSSEGRKLLMGSYGWETVQNKPSKADVLFENLLLYSGALALFRNPRPA